MNAKELQKLLDKFALDWAPTGSREICDPAPTDTDEDYVVLGNDRITGNALLLSGMEQTSDDEYDGGHWMKTFRLAEFNVVLTNSSVFFDRFVAATLLAKQRNILDKSRRIALFQDILYASVDYEDFSQ